MEGTDSDPPLTRRRFLLGLGGLAVGGTLLEGLVLEPRRISVTMHQIGAPTSPGASPLRLVQLTDLHLKSVGSFEQAIAERVRALEPEVILITGDALDRSDALPLLEAFLRLLPDGATRFATLGNWEYWSGLDLDGLADVYRAADCRLLVNEAARLTYVGRAADFVGLDDLVAGQPDVGAVARSRPTGPNTLLLSHCPAYRDAPVGNPLDAAAMLSGHTHGGQFAVGGWAPLRPPGSGPYVAGWYRGGSPDLYVSRGLGTSVVPVRLGSVPEISCFDWFLEPA